MFHCVQNTFDIVLLMTIRFYQQSQLTEWVSFYLLMIRWWSQLTKSIYSNKINTVEKLQFIFISLENCRNYYYYLLYYYRLGLLFITIYILLYIYHMLWLYTFFGGESFIGIPKNMGLTWLNMAYNHATNHDKLELNMVLEENLRAWWSRSC